MTAKKLRAVAPGETVEPPKAPKTVTEAADSGTTREAQEATKRADATDQPFNASAI